LQFSGGYANISHGVCRGGACPYNLQNYNYEEKDMGVFKEEITLKNSADVVISKRGMLPAEEVRGLTIDATVDTGAVTLVIPDALRQQLGLEIKGTRVATLAGGTKVPCNVTEPVEIRWKDRDCDLPAWSLPGGSVLLGAMPLEAMDLMVDPVRQRLVGAHGNEPTAEIV
jgi:clan AA aspartic protease